MPKPMMMFKSVVNGVESFFHFDQACTTEIAKLALLEALKWIGQIEDASKAAAQPPAVEAPPENAAPESPPEA